MSEQIAAASGTQTTPSSSPAVAQKTETGSAITTSASANQSASTGEAYGEQWWKEHGEHVFKHPRFKELNECKHKYEKIAPIEQLASTLGGVEGLQQFSTYFGPVWQKLMDMGDTAGQAWEKIYPVLNAFLTGEESVNNDVSNEPREGDALEKYIEKHISPIKGELDNIKKSTQQKEAQAVYKQYETLFDKKFKEAGFAEDNVQLKKFVGNIFANFFPQHFPKGKDGKAVHPLQQFNEAAFNNAWNKIIMENFKNIESHYGSKFLKTSESGGPSVPSSLNGEAVKNVKPQSFTDKVNRLKSMI